MSSLPDPDRFRDSLLDSFSTRDGRSSLLTRDTGRRVISIERWYESGLRIADVKSLADPVHSEQKDSAQRMMPNETNLEKKNLSEPLNNLPSRVPIEVSESSEQHTSELSNIEISSLQTSTEQASNDNYTAALRALKQRKTAVEIGQNSTQLVQTNQISLEQPVSNEPVLIVAATTEELNSASGPQTETVANPEKNVAQENNLNKDIQSDGIFLHNTFNLLGLTLN